MFRKEVPFAYGHPENPISKQDLFNKFKDCARYSVRSLTEGQMERVIGMVDRLEEVEDVREIVRLLE